MTMPRMGRSLYRAAHVARQKVPSITAALWALRLADPAIAVPVSRESMSKLAR
jgi:hypothetical protein